MKSRKKSLLKKMLISLLTRANPAIFSWWTKTWIKWTSKTQMVTLWTMINGLSFSCTTLNMLKLLMKWWVGYLVKPWKKKKQIGLPERPSNQWKLMWFQAKAKNQGRSAWTRSRWASKNSRKSRRRRSRRSWRSSKNSRLKENSLRNRSKNKLRKKSLISLRIRLSLWMKASLKTSILLGNHALLFSLVTLMLVNQQFAEILCISWESSMRGQLSSTKERLKIKTETLGGLPTWWTPLKRKKPRVKLSRWEEPSLTLTTRNLPSLMLLVIRTMCQTWLWELPLLM